MDENEKNTAADNVRHKKALSPLKERASKTAKVLWTGVGALATLGGVVGLVQVFSANNSGGLPAGPSSQDVLMEMVKSGDIEVADAERLAELLYGENGAADTTGLQDIAKSGTDRQKEALTLLAERHSRDEGLDILEAEAKTGADWRLVAELAYSFEPKRSLAAVKKAIALDPEDFRAVTLMSQVQAGTGDYASARRSAITAELLATTKIERVMAARSSLGILVSGTNVSDIPEGIETLKTALDELAPDIETTPLPVKFDSAQDAEIHPLYVLAAPHEAIANAALYIADADAVKQHSELAIADLKEFALRVPASDSAKLKRRIASNYDNPIFAEYGNKNWPELMRLAGDQLEIYRELAESGDKRTQANLSTYYGRYSSYALYSGETDIVRSASSRSLTLAQLAADRRPDDVKLALDVVQTELSQALVLQAIGDDVNLVGSLDKMMTSLEDTLRGQPDDIEDSPWNRYSGLIARLVAIFNTDEFEFDDNPTEEMLARSENFLDSEIFSRPEAHDPRHARNSLFIMMGDHANQLKKVEAARTAYQRALADAVDIPPTEKEPDVVELSKLVALHRLVAIEEEGIEPKDRPEFNDVLELAQRLDQEGKLITIYQPILSFLIAERDGTMPAFPGQE